MHRGSKREQSQDSTVLPTPDPPPCSLSEEATHTYSENSGNSCHLASPAPRPPFPLIRGPPLLEPLVFLSWTHSKTFQPHSDIHFGVLLHHRHLLSQGFLPAAGLTTCQPCFTALASSGYLLLKKKNLLSRLSSPHLECGSHHHPGSDWVTNTPAGSQVCDKGGRRSFCHLQESLSRTGISDQIHCQFPEGLLCSIPCLFQGPSLGTPL